MFQAASKKVSKTKSYNGSESMARQRDRKEKRHQLPEDSPPSINVVDATPLSKPDGGPFSSKSPKSAGSSEALGALGDGVPRRQSALRLMVPGTQKHMLAPANRNGSPKNADGSPHDSPTSAGALAMGGGFMTRPGYIQSPKAVSPVGTPHPGAASPRPGETAPVSHAPPGSHHAGAWKALRANAHQQRGHGHGSGNAGGHFLFGGLGGAAGEHGHGHGPAAHGHAHGHDSNTKEAIHQVLYDFMQQFQQHGAPQFPPGYQPPAASGAHPAPHAPRHGTAHGPYVPRHLDGLVTAQQAARHLHGTDAIYDGHGHLHTGMTHPGMPGHVITRDAGLAGTHPHHPGMATPALAAAAVVKGHGGRGSTRKGTIVPVLPDGTSKHMVMPGRELPAPGTVAPEVTPGRKLPTPFSHPAGMLTAMQSASVSGTTIPGLGTGPSKASALGSEGPNDFGIPTKTSGYGSTLGDPFMSNINTSDGGSGYQQSSGGYQQSSNFSSNPMNNSLRPGIEELLRKRSKNAPIPQSPAGGLTPRSRSKETAMNPMTSGHPDSVPSGHLSSHSQPHPFNMSLRSEVPTLQQGCAPPLSGVSVLPPGAHISLKERLRKPQGGLGSASKIAQLALAKGAMGRWSQGGPGNIQTNDLSPQSADPSMRHLPYSRSSIPDKAEAHGNKLMNTILADRRISKFGKDKLIERLFMEDLFENQIVRAICFVVALMLLYSMCWRAYPSDEISHIHRVIRKAYSLDDRAKKVETMTQLQDYLLWMAEHSGRYFSPGSRMHVDGHLSKAYLDDIVMVPPIIRVPRTKAPLITSHFTMLSWIKVVDDNFDGMITKVSDYTWKEGGTDTKPNVCWQLGLKGVYYAGHEEHELTFVPNPLYDKSSFLKSRLRYFVRDSNWHHYGVMVNATHIRFVLDGVFLDAWRKLPAPLTDCRDGHVIIGANFVKNGDSTRISSLSKYSGKGYAQLTQLHWYPRVLNEKELKNWESDTVENLIAGNTLLGINLHDMAGKIEQLWTWTHWNDDIGNREGGANYKMITNQTTGGNHIMSNEALFRSSTSMSLASTSSSDCSAVSVATRAAARLDMTSRIQVNKLNTTDTVVAEKHCANDVIVQFVSDQHYSFCQGSLPVSWNWDQYQSTVVEKQANQNYVSEQEAYYRTVILQGKRDSSARKQLSNGDHIRNFCERFFVFPLAETPISNEKCSLFLDHFFSRAFMCAHFPWQSTDERRNQYEAWVRSWDTIDTASTASDPREASDVMTVDMLGDCRIEVRDVASRTADITSTAAVEDAQDTVYVMQAGEMTYQAPAYFGPNIWNRTYNPTTRWTLDGTGSMKTIIAADNVNPPLFTTTDMNKLETKIKNQIATVRQSDIAVTVGGLTSNSLVIHYNSSDSNDMFFQAFGALSSDNTTAEWISFHGSIVSMLKKSYAHYWFIEELRSVEAKCSDRQHSRSLCSQTCGFGCGKPSLSSSEKDKRRRSLKNAVLESCVDGTVFMDGDGRGCSWYAVHSYECSADAELNCPLACGTCSIGEKVLEKFVREEKQATVPTIASPVVASALPSSPTLESLEVDDSKKHLTISELNDFLDTFQDISRSEIPYVVPRASLHRLGEMCCSMVFGRAHFGMQCDSFFYTKDKRHNREDVLIEDASRIADPLPRYPRLFREGRHMLREFFQQVSIKEYTKKFSNRTSDFEVLKGIKQATAATASTNYADRHLLSILFDSCMDAHFPTWSYREDEDSEATAVQFTSSQSSTEKSYFYNHAVFPIWSLTHADSSFRPFLTDVVEYIGASVYRGNDQEELSNALMSKETSSAYASGYSVDSTKVLYFTDGPNKFLKSISITNSGLLSSAVYLECTNSATDCRGDDVVVTTASSGSSGAVVSTPYVDVSIWKNTTVEALSLASGYEPMNIGSVGTIGHPYQNTNNPFLLYSSSTHSAKGQEPLFCSKMCLTGGCGISGSSQYGRVPGATHGYCQPCSVCRTEYLFSDTVCPSYCLQSTQNAIAKSERPSVVEKKEYKLNTISTAAQTSIKNADESSFSLETWARNFAGQTIVEKEINFEENAVFPNSEWEHYAIEKIKIKGLEQFLSSSNNCEQALKTNLDGLYRGVSIPEGKDAGSEVVDRIEQYEKLGDDPTYNAISLAASGTSNGVDVLLNRRYKRAFVHDSGKVVLEHLEEAGEGAWFFFSFIPDCVGVVFGYGEATSGRPTDAKILPFRSPLNPDSLSESTQTAMLQNIASNSKRSQLFASDKFAGFRNTFRSEYTGTLTSVERPPIAQKSTFPRVEPYGGSLKCWRWTVAQFCYRSHWAQRDMTCVDSHTTVNGDDQWNHLAIAKEGSSLTFFRNGKKTRTAEIDRNFWDCGGEQRSKLGGKYSNSFFGFDLYNSELVEQSRVRTLVHDSNNATTQLRISNGMGSAHFSQMTNLLKDHFSDLQHVYPLAGARSGESGHHYGSVFSFSSVEISKRSYIQNAQLDFCVHQTLAESFLSKKCAITKTIPSRTHNLRVYGLRPSSTRVSRLARVEKETAVLESSSTSSSTSSSLAYDADSFNLRLMSTTEGNSDQTLRDMICGANPEWELTDSFTDWPVFENHFIAEKQNCLSYDKDMDSKTSSLDISAIISELTQTTYWQNEGSMHFAIVHEDVGNVCSKISRPEILNPANGMWETQVSHGIQSMEEKYADLVVKESLENNEKLECSLVHEFIKPLQTHFPLLVGGAPKLKTEHCLNAECVNPKFLSGVSEKRSVGTTSPLCLSRVDGMLFNCNAPMAVFYPTPPVSSYAISIPGTTSSLLSYQDTSTCSVAAEQKTLFSACHCGIENAIGFVDGSYSGITVYANIASPPRTKAPHTPATALQSEYKQVTGATVDRDTIFSKVIAISNSEFFHELHGLDILRQPEHARFSPANDFTSMQHSEACLPSAGSSATTAARTGTTLAEIQGRHTAPHYKVSRIVLGNRATDDSTSAGDNLTFDLDLEIKRTSSVASIGSGASISSSLTTGEVFPTAAQLDGSTTAAKNLFLDYSAMTYLHVDVYIEARHGGTAVTDVSLGLVASGWNIPDAYPILANYRGNSVVSNTATTPVIQVAIGQWVSLDLPLSDFKFFGSSTGGFVPVGSSLSTYAAPNKIQRIRMAVHRSATEVQQLGAVVVYLDNVYFYADGAARTNPWGVTVPVPVILPHMLSPSASSARRALKEVEVGGHRGARTAVVEVTPDGDIRRELHPFSLTLSSGKTILTGSKLSTTMTLGAPTSIVAGVFFAEGMLYDPRYSTKALSLAEVQTRYQLGKKVENMQGPMDDVDRENHFGTNAELSPIQTTRSFGAGSMFAGLFNKRKLDGRRELHGADVNSLHQGTQVFHAETSSTTAEKIISTLTRQTTPPTARLPEESASLMVISKYPQEIVAVAPPIMMQRRSPLGDCKDVSPTLHGNLDKYLARQVQKKCKSPNAADFYDLNFQKSTENDEMASYQCLTQPDYINIYAQDEFTEIFDETVAAKVYDIVDKNSHSDASARRLSKRLSKNPRSRVNHAASSSDSIDRRNSQEIGEKDSLLRRVGLSAQSDRTTFDGRFGVNAASARRKLSTTSYVPSDGSSPAMTNALSFSCVDRDESIESTFWSRNPMRFLSDASTFRNSFEKYVGIRIPGQEGRHDVPVYPEYLELLNQHTIFRDGNMHPSRTWIDIQTSSVIIFGVFLSPGKRSGTILSISFDYRGQGRMKAHYEMYSYVQMSQPEQREWITRVVLFFIFTSLEFALFARSVVTAKRWRERWHRSIADTQALKLDGNTRDLLSLRKRAGKKIRETVVNGVSHGMRGSLSLGRLRGTSGTGATSSTAMKDALQDVENEDDVDNADVKKIVQDDKEKKGCLGKMCEKISPLKSVTDPDGKVRRVSSFENVVVNAEPLRTNVKRHVKNMATGNGFRDAFLGDLTEDQRVYLRVIDGINQNIPILNNWWDFIDLLLRGAMIFYAYVHVRHYYAPSSPDESDVYSGMQANLNGTGNVMSGNSGSTIDPNNLGTFEYAMYKITSLDWSNPEISHDNKMKGYVTELNVLRTEMDWDRNIRGAAFWLMMLLLARFIVYLGYHPRVAILYKTMQVAADDLFHFFVVFLFVYVFFAAIANWQFGSEIEAFSTGGSTIYTQFQLIIGEMVWEDWETLEKKPYMGKLFFYLITYVIIVFFALMNFFLAIIVGSYQRVKEQVKVCEVENNLLMDICACISYRVFTYICRWPKRLELAYLLLDVKTNEKSEDDSEGDEDLGVTLACEELLETDSGHKIFESLDDARIFFVVMKFFCPSLDVTEVSADVLAEDAILEHSFLLQRQNNLNIIRNRLVEAKKAGDEMEEELGKFMNDMRIAKKEADIDRVPADQRAGFTATGGGGGPGGPGGLVIGGGTLPGNSNGPSVGSRGLAALRGAFGGAKGDKINFDAHSDNSKLSKERTAQVSISKHADPDTILVDPDSDDKNRFTVLSLPEEFASKQEINIDDIAVESSSASAESSQNPDQSRPNSRAGSKLSVGKGILKDATQSIINSPTKDSPSKDSPSKSAKRHSGDGIFDTVDGTHNVGGSLNAGVEREDTEEHPGIIAFRGPSTMELGAKHGDHKGEVPGIPAVSNSRSDNEIMFNLVHSYSQLDVTAVEEKSKSDKIVRGVKNVLLPVRRLSADAKLTAAKLKAQRGGDGSQSGAQSGGTSPLERLKALSPLNAFRRMSSSGSRSGRKSGARVVLPRKEELKKDGRM